MRNYFFSILIPFGLLASACGGSDSSSCDKIIKDVCGEKADDKCKAWVKNDWLEGQGDAACKIITEDEGMYKSAILPNAKSEMQKALGK